MAKQRETRRQQRIQKAIRKAFPKCFIAKNHGGPYSHAGLPDLTAVIEGRAVYVEVKEPDGTVSAIQWHVMKQIKRAGGIAFVGVEPDDVVEQIKAELDV